MPVSPFVAVTPADVESTGESAVPVTQPNRPTVNLASTSEYPAGATAPRGIDVSARAAGECGRGGRGRVKHKVTVQAFRRKVLRELIKIKFAWPEMCYRTVRGGLVVSPSPPRIAATHLRLIE